MSIKKSISKVNIYIQSLILILGIVLFAFVFHNQAKGQTSSSVALRGSYSSLTTDGMNIFSGKLEQVLPLINIQGRGEVEQGLFLPLRNADWSVVETASNSTNDRTYYYYEPKLGYDLLGNIGYETNLSKFVRAGYSTIGKMEVETTYSGEIIIGPTVTGLKFTFNNGSIIEFRDVLTNGEPFDPMQRGCYLSGYQQPPQPPQACSRGKVFRSTDGSNAIFVADTDIYDMLFYDAFGHITTSQTTAGTMYFSNGSKLRIENSLPNYDGSNTKVTQIVDRNGNYINFEYSINFYYHVLTKITDSLNREVTIEYGDHTQTSFYDEIVYKGFGGHERRIRINYTNVENAMLPGEELTSIFPGVVTRCYTQTGTPCETTGVNPGGNHTANTNKVLSSVVLPNGKEYKVYYNRYLEVARIKTPLGSYIDYNYSNGVVGAGSDGYSEPLYSGGGSISRRISSVKSYNESGQLITEKTFSDIPQFVPATSSTIDNVVIDLKDSSGTTLSKSKHYFYGLVDSLGKSWATGKEYKTEILDPTTQSVIRKTEITWEQREPFPWCNYGIGWGSCDNTNWPLIAPSNDPRITEIRITLETGQITKQSFSYDQYNNITDTYDYDFGNGQVGQFLRRSHNDYVTDTNYTSYIGAHLKRLPLQSWVSSDIAGENKASLVQYEYDNYGVNSLVSRSNVSGHDSTNHGISNTLRGNITKVKSYADAQNQTGEISTQTQYDVLGNVIKTVDAKGFITTIDYSDRFGTPDGEAQNNTPPIQLNGQSTFAFPTSGTNALNWIVGYAQFDYFSGAGVDSEDINGNVSTVFYNDVLDRPTQTISANNRPSLRSQTTTVYDDVNRKVTITTDLYSFGDNRAKSESFYDSLGRTTETRKYETGGFIVTSKPQYDDLSREIQSTTPYRPYLNEQPTWTTTTFDSLGRVIKVITADNQEVTNNYSGNATITIDQAGKKSRNITNAIGQVIRVDEPNNNNDLGDISNPTQPTYYTYNPVGNLVKVLQGQQNRYFMYDSLGRLIRVRQPEQNTNSSLAITDSITGNDQWSTGSTYDANGNTLTTTDAKGITITNTYDNLNRPLTRTYSDATPTVTYTYDDSNIPFSKGQLTKVSSTISETRYTLFDALGRINSSEQLTTPEQRNGTQQPYSMIYSYNLSGSLVEETYPSGRIVKNSFDNDGQLNDITSKATWQTDFHLSANNFVYSASGFVTSMRLGNGLWQSAQLNSRFQIIQIGLGTSQGATNLWKINYDYGEFDSNGELDTGKNNGNIARQTINFTGLSQAFIQTYKYDSLNRLTEAKEMSGTTQTWIQNFGYDRYSNRIGFNQQKVGEQQITQTPTVDPAKNRFTTGQGFVYDFNGNLITDDQGRQFTFNGDNKQIEVKDSANNVIGLYYYDGNGNRIKKISVSETTIFVYDAFGKLIAEYSTQVATADTATISYLTNDALGSPRVITDNGGGVVSRRDFMPFGEELYAGTANRTEMTKYNLAGADNVRKRFTGYEKDIETGLGFAEARMYDSTFGRFTAVDPLLVSGQSANPQTFNRYAYVANNPVVLTDPTGMFIEAWSHGGLLYQLSNQTFDNPFQFLEMAAQQSQSDGQPSISERVRDGLVDSLMEKAREKAEELLPAIFMPIPTTDSLSTSASGGRQTLGFGKIVTFVRPTIVAYWVFQPTGRRVLGAILMDVTKADVVFSAVNVGEEGLKEEPYFGLHGGWFDSDESSHIIAKSLGGSRRSKNLTSLSLGVNRSNMSSMELRIRRKLTDDPTLTARITVQLLYSILGLHDPLAAEILPDYIKKRPFGVFYRVRFINPQGRTVDRLMEFYPNPPLR